MTRLAWWCAAALAAAPACAGRASTSGSDATATAGVGAAAPAAPAAVPAAGDPRREGPVSGDAERRRLAAALGDSLRRVVDAAVADSAFPGAFAVVGDRAGVLAQYGGGHLDWAPSPVPDENTLWDLASLTKVVATTSAVAQLAGEGSIDVEARAQLYLRGWTGAGKERVRVRDLLTHSAGLPAWRPLYKEASSAEGALALVYATPLDTLPNVRYLYSDLGAIVAGKLVEAVAGMPLDRYLAERVFGPLGMRDTRFRPPASELGRTAPTEYDPWRQRKLRGEVHDENAFALGGVSGHAGLFSTGHDLARFARMYLNWGALDGARVIDSLGLTAFVRRQDPALSHRALGWETPTGENSAGHLMSPRAYGHTGFTGTSLWADPENDVFVVLLTNRVNPTRQNAKIGRVRVALADAVLATVQRARASTPPSSPARP